MKNFKLTKVTNSIFVLDLFLNENDDFTRSFIVNGNFSVLIDTGVRDSANDIVDAFSKTGFTIDNLKLIFNSHGHFDHIGSNHSIKQFSGGLIAAPKKAVKWIEDFDSQYNESLNRFPDILSISSEEKIDFYNKIGSPEKVDLQIEGEVTINLGKRIILNIYPSPGHTNADISFYETKSKTLIICDTILGEGINDYMPEINFPNDYLKTLEKLEKLEVKTLLTSHFPIIKDEKIKEYFKTSKDYFSKIEKLVKELNKKHKGDLEKITNETCKKLNKKFSIHALCTIEGFLKNA